jgi:hypothetical protein
MAGIVICDDSGMGQDCRKQRRYEVLGISEKLSVA